MGGLPFPGAKGLSSDSTVLLQSCRLPTAQSEVDAEVGAALEAELLDHGTSALWLTDVVRAICRYLYMEWLASVDDARTRLCGVTRAPLRNMAAWSRADQTMFSRSRTNALLELGTYRIRL